MSKKTLFFILLSAFVFLSPSIANASVYSNLSKLTNVSYIAGKELYAKNSNLTAKQSYVACESLMKSYNDALGKQKGNSNYERFLYYMSPAEVTYCWAGYLDAAGQNK